MRESEYRAWLFPPSPPRLTLLSSCIASERGIQQILYTRFLCLQGPSGIGKSFLTKQLAHQNHAYVVYVCLATNDAHPYPLQSSTANLFARPSRRDQMITLVECFVAADLARIKLCRSVGINTAKFYGMQIQEMFSSLQNIFKDCLEQFFNGVMGDLGAAGKTRRVRSNDVEPDEDYDYTEYVDRSMAWYESPLPPVFGELKKELQKSDVFRCFLSTEPIGLGMEPGGPAVICFDETRDLFSKINGGLKPLIFPEESTEGSVAIC